MARDIQIQFRVFDTPEQFVLRDEQTRRLIKVSLQIPPEGSPTKQNCLWDFQCLKYQNVDETDSHLVRFQILRSLNIYIIFVGFIKSEGIRDFRVVDPLLVQLSLCKLFFFLKRPGSMSQGIVQTQDPHLCGHHLTNSFISLIPLVWRSQTLGLDRARRSIKGLPDCDPTVIDKLVDK